jgi:RNA polymerase sigma-70 factor, ECF subfamily
MSLRRRSLRSTEGWALFVANVLSTRGLFPIAVNSAKNFLMARIRNSMASTSAWLDADDASVLRVSLQATDTPEELAFTEEMRGAVNATLERLTEAHRAAIALRDIDGITYAQLVAATDAPVGTVRSRLFQSPRAHRPSSAHRS